MIFISKANIASPDDTPLELYRILLSQMQYEEKLIKQFEKINDEINTILDLRKNELESPLLKFCIFDSLRNKAARKKRLQLVRKSIRNATLSLPIETT